MQALLESDVDGFAAASTRGLARDPAAFVVALASLMVVLTPADERTRWLLRWLSLSHEISTVPTKGDG